MTTDVTTDVAQYKTDEEFIEEFCALNTEEIAHQGKLNETIFAMGDLLNRWGPDEKTLRTLAREYGYRVDTLRQRMHAAREIPAEHRNPKLSFTAHLAVLDIKIPDDDRADQPERAEAAQAARFELLADPTDSRRQVPLGEVTANKMKVLVRSKRVELGQISTPDRQFGSGAQRPRGGVQTPDGLQERMARLGRSGGLAISDQNSIVKLSAAFEEDGDVTITIENTADYEIQPAVNSVNGRPRKFTVTYTLDTSDTGVKAVEA